MADDTNQDKLIQEVRTLATLYGQHQQELTAQMEQLRDQQRQANQALTDSVALIDSRVASLEQIRLDLVKVSQSLVLLYGQLLKMFRVKAE